MKNKFLRLLYLFSASLFCSLIACEKIDDDTIILKVVINNNVEEAFSLSNDSFSYKKELKPNNDYSTLIDTLSLPKSGYYNFTFRGNMIQLYVERGEKVGISFNADNFLNTVSFSQGSKNENTYLMDKYGLNHRFIRKNSTSLKSEKFLAAIFKHRDEMLNLLEKSNSSSTFKNKEIKEITYKTAIDQLSYSSVHAGLKGRKSLDIGKNYYDNLASINYIDTLLYANPETGNYRFLVTYYFTKIANDKKKAYGNDQTLAFLNEVDMAFPNGFAKDDLFQFKTRAGLDHNSPNLDEIYTLISQTMQNETYLESITQDYERIIGLKKGSTAPNFTLEDANGSTKTLADFKGKIIYIDIWATYNSLYLEELSALGERINQYKNIEFVTVSIDSKNDYEKWKSYVNGRDLDATNLIAYNNSEFQQNYNIKSIPRYVLIDQKGNIVSVDAPKPSDRIGLKRLIDRIKS